MELSKEGLKRAIGPAGLSANVVNLVIGAGIFVLPSKVYESLGNGSIIAYLACGVLIFLIMLCFAEVGCRVSKTGGIYAYTESAFGPFIGFTIINLYGFGWGLGSDAAIINALGEMLATYWPVFNISYVKAVLFATSFILIAWVNVRGVQYGSWLVEFMTLAKIIPLGLLVLIGWGCVSSSNLLISGWPSPEQIGEASLFLFFVFGGAEGSLTASGEIKNPSRTVPVGVLWGITSVVVIYVSVHLVTQGILGSQMITFKDAPLAEASRQIFGPAGTGLILVCLAISVWGAISGDVLATSRFLFAASSDKLYPAFLSKIHPRFLTPYWAIIVYSLLGFLLSMTNTFKALAILSSAAILITYLAVVLAAIKFRMDGKTVKGEGFMIAGGYTVHIVTLLIILWFLSHLSKQESYAMIITLSLFGLVYLINKLRKSGSNEQADG